MKAFFDLGGKRRLGEVVQPNQKTVWVKVMMGAKTYIVIKRHKVKHKVRYVRNSVPRTYI